MMNPFDALRADDLRNSTSSKWLAYPGEVLPLWVADMDFPPAEAIRAAVTRHAQEGFLGYAPNNGIPGLKEAVAERLGQRYGLRVTGENISLLSGTVSGLFLGVRSLSSVHDEVVVQTPIYPRFLQGIEGQGRVLTRNSLIHNDRGWQVDFDALKACITPATRLLMLCNPHNPSGRVFTLHELERFAEIALEHRLWVIADELHADLIHEGRHIPFASLGEEIAARTLTLYGPTKAFNIAGLNISFALSHNPAILERLAQVADGLGSKPNVLAQVATLAAYREAGEWLEQALSYLKANRDCLSGFLARHLPEIGYSPPEGTYLTLLDFRKTRAAEDPQAFLLEHAGVALEPGPNFGPEGAGWARLNFATSRAILLQALERIRNAL
ncbi:MAG: PatB family C-S lyase [Trueperaceae bacterium]|nr:MAG: PatB family C-S lyase [Trueperaceae bacterium]